MARSPLWQRDHAETDKRDDQQAAARGYKPTASATEFVREWGAKDPSNLPQGFLSPSRSGVRYIRLTLGQPRPGETLVGVITCTSSEGIRSPVRNAVRPRRDGG
jgi:hypothetical protein